MVSNCLELLFLSPFPLSCYWYTFGIWFFDLLQLLTWEIRSLFIPSSEICSSWINLFVINLKKHGLFPHLVVFLHLISFTQSFRSCVLLYFFFRCKQAIVIVVEMDRILRPGGWAIIRDKVEILNPLEEILRSLQWEIRMTFAQDREGILCAQKTMWRPWYLLLMLALSLYILRVF